MVTLLFVMVEPTIFPQTVLSVLSKNLAESGVVTTCAFAETRAINKNAVMLNFIMQTY